MRFFGLTAAFFLTLVGVAEAHVAPAVNTNNRYLKLTPLGDRVRLAYTVYFGQIPGQLKRQEIDKNKDKTIDDGEATDFGRVMATKVLRALQVTADGQRLAFDWHEVHVGLGKPVTSEGAFSVDAVAWLCLDNNKKGNAKRHDLILIDKLELDRPGETELRLEAGPGISVVNSGFADRDLKTEYTWNGPDSPLKKGYRLVMDIGPEAASPNDGKCAARPGTSPKEKNKKKRDIAGWIAVVGVALLGGSMLRFTLKKKKKRRSKKS